MVGAVGSKHPLTGNIYPDYRFRAANAARRLSGLDPKRAQHCRIAPPES